MSFIPSASTLWWLGSVVVLGAASMTGQKSSAKKPTGEQLFLSRCAGCHGAKGEGGRGYSSPMVGDKSADALSQYIHASMPPTGKKTSVADAQAIARYVYDAFYSPIAQERNRPARVAVQRLTVRQFRNALADLIGPYHGAVPNTTERGLKARYFKGRNEDEKSKAFERVDPVVNFDFGVEAPAKEGFDAHSFTIVWQGSLVAPDTGEYEFCVKSDHAIRLWLNGYKKPFIDAWVKSGKETEFRGVISLIGGQAYPLRMEFSKSTQGVSDADKKKKTKPPAPAFVELRWRRPHLAEETIPTERLLPVGVATSYVCDTPFPPDDRSIGYERGNAVSRAWDDATTSAAFDAANRLVANLPEYAGIPDDAADRPKRIQDFAAKFVERAFRRPVTPEVKSLFVDKQFAGVADPEVALKRVVVLTLKSPRFLYRAGSDGRDAYSIAEDLAFDLWDAPPDPELVRAAASGRLDKPEQVEAQARRLANDPRAWMKLREFLLAWLKVDEVNDLVKSAKRYPDFDASVATDLRTSLEVFLENVAGQPDSDYRDLFLSTKQFFNPRLAKLYGMTPGADPGFRAFDFEPDRRAGALTHPYLLSRFAYLEGSSPIHRGVLIMRIFLGRKLQPPPAAVAPFAASLHPNLTTRERVTLQTKPEFCSGCHSKINPLGFALEGFDAIGKARERDGVKPVDASGWYVDGAGRTVRFTGATELGKYIAQSDEAHAAFVDKLFQFLVKQPILAYGPDERPTLVREFAENRYSIRNLMVRIATTTALHQPNPSPGAN